MVARFYLDQSQLDDANVGLDGPSPAFVLDTSPLDGNGVLDGTTFTTPATAAAPLGGLSASATGTVTPVITATADAQLGELLAEVAEVNVEVVADAQADLGGLAASGSAIVSDTGEADAPLGGLTASASGDITIFASADALLGELIATAAAGITIVAEASAGLGEATSAATGVITVVGSAETVLGGLVASADGIVSADAVGDAPLGGLDASATGTVTPQPTPPQPQQFVGGQPYRQRKPRPKKVEPVVELVPEVVVANPKTVQAYCTPIVASVKASASGEITFVAEDDDLQVLLML
jgi:hypothetical protein